MKGPLSHAVYKLPSISSPRYKGMAAILAAAQRRLQSICGDLRSASARSAIRRLLLWALGLSRSRGNGACGGRFTS